ncbi:energy-coupling factor transporter transmembrane component T [Columbia Basin potato purple top phytoplasma]|uniref:Energy-coupling factor transporter transmembrane protein EcfT n=1 Tax=Columbia Basin potato purple top phytoplasma TaxID=307134 RepID=A0ABT5L8H7_9MOLU|nr:energy-coupling factor transporter transmembrane component T [Columbia Basin potato purple top phytoplasma]MDC9031955.1 energy-coupling factor transporter transmembrane protein EcfT [Columbia Basin potato purple top phytoplasma]
MEMINKKNDKYESTLERKSFIYKINPSIKIILFIFIFKIIFSLNLDLNSELTSFKILFYICYFIFFLFIFYLLLNIVPNFFRILIRQILSFKFFVFLSFFLNLSSNPKTENFFSFSIFPNNLALFLFLILFLYLISFFLFTNRVYKNIYFIFMFVFFCLLPSFLHKDQEFFLKLYYNKKILLNIFFIFIRICLFFMVNFLISKTTSFVEIKDGLEFLLKPFKIIKFPVEMFSLMMSLIFLSMPFLIEESQKIIKAQLSRGLNFYTKNILKKILYLVSILIPILILSFKKSFALANAMETRGYVLGKPKTKFNVYKIKRYDIFIFFLFLSFFIFSFYA